MRLEIDGVGYSVTDTQGELQPMVLIHGWCCDVSDWDSLVAGLARKYRVIVPELPGHGGSDLSPRGYSPQSTAADICGILDALKIQAAVLVGHSLGGVVATSIAVQRPDLACAVVVIDPAYGRLEGHGLQVRQWLREWRGAETRRSTIEFLTREPGTPPAAEIRKARRRRIAEGMQAEVIWQTLQDLHLGPQQVSTRPRSTRFVIQRQVPVLAIHADSGRAAWEQASSSHSSSVTEYWPGTSHWLHQDEPQRFLACLEKFLAENVTASECPACRSRIRPEFAGVRAEWRPGSIFGLPVFGCRGCAAGHILREIRQAGAGAAVPFISAASRLPGGLRDLQVLHNQLAALRQSDPGECPAALATLDQRLGGREACDEAERCLSELDLDGVYFWSASAGAGDLYLIRAALEMAEGEGKACVINLRSADLSVVQRLLKPYASARVVLLGDLLSRDFGLARALTESGAIVGVSGRDLSSPGVTVAALDGIDPGKLILEAGSLSNDIWRGMPEHRAESAAFVTQVQDATSSLVRSVMLAGAR